MPVSDNKRVVERFDVLLNIDDHRPLDELCAPDMVNHALGPTWAAGLEGTRDYLGSAGRSFRSDRWREVVVVAERDLVVQFGVRQGCWPGGSFRGFPMPSGDYTRDLACLYRLADRRITERWAVRDDLGMMLQLCALEPD